MNRENIQILSEDEALALLVNHDSTIDDLATRLRWKQVFSGNLALMDQVSSGQQPSVDSLGLMARLRRHRHRFGDLNSTATYAREFSHPHKSEWHSVELDWSIGASNCDPMLTSQSRSGRSMHDLCQPSLTPTTAWLATNWTNL